LAFAGLEKNQLCHHGEPEGMADWPQVVFAYTRNCLQLFAIIRIYSRLSAIFCAASITRFLLVEFSMKSLPLVALVLTLGLSFATPDAEARRLGGGMSSGMNRGSSITQRQAAPAPAPAQNMSQAARPAAATPATPAAPQPSGMRRWLGPLAGLAAGVGLAALFSHLGMGAGMGSFLMVLLAGVAIFLVVRLLMRRSTPALQPAGVGANYAPEPRFEPVAAAAPQTSAAGAQVPTGFDTDGFLRQAKLNFIRLQAANDTGNMDDIRAFTAPEMYAEIQMQYQERSKAKQQTDVMQLDAALLDVTDEAARQLASVRFFGLIRETAEAAPENFSEVWHLTRPLDGSQGWKIAGIEQVS